MSKLKLDKINFDSDDFLVEVNKKETKKNLKEDKISDEEKQELELKKQQEEEIKKQAQERIDEAELILNRARDEAQNIVDDARKEADDIKKNVEAEIQTLKEEIIKKAQDEANEIIKTAKETSQQENELLIANSKEEIEKERIEITTKGYQEGYQDGLDKIQEELEEKIKDFDIFFKTKYEIKDKILKAANRDIINLITNISKKILLYELDGEKLDKIIKNAVSLLEKKENITIILSQKYAKLLFEYQKKSLNEEIEFNFEDFKQYDNFDIVYNSEFSDDTIIVENLKERFDASLNVQLDTIVRNIYDNSQNGKLDLEEYIEEDIEKNET